ncbi:MAG: tetratricopeptide repeat protein [bacterium]
MPNSAADRARLAFFALLAYYLGALALHAAFGMTDGRGAWAFLHWRPFPFAARIAFSIVGAAIGCGAIAVYRMSARGARSATANAVANAAVETSANATPHSRRLTLVLVALGLFAIVAITAGNRNEFFGDIKLYQDKFEAAKSGPILRDPIDRLPDRTIMTINYALFRAGRGVWERLRARDVFAATSIASGAAYVVLAAWLASRWGRGSLLFLFCSPAMLLFLGYGEHYGAVSAGIMLTLVLGFRACQREIEAWWVLAVALGVSCLHLAATILLPAAVYLLVTQRRDREVRPTHDTRGSRRPLGAITACVVLAVVVCAFLAEVALRPATSTLGKITLPLVRDDSVPYSLFAFEHIAFVGGAVLFIGLLPLGAIVWALIAREPAARAAALAHPFTRFVLIALASALGFAFVIDPKLGVRDWDLLSLFSVPLHVAAAWLVSARDDAIHQALGETRSFTPRNLAAPILLCAGIAVWHTGPWIAANARTERAAALTQEWVESDARYTSAYSAASDVTPFLKLASIFERADLPQRALHCAQRSAEVSPNSVESWITIGKLLRNAGRRDEAAVALGRASALAPANFLPAYLEGLCLAESGRYAGAIAAFDRALAAAPRNAEVHAAREQCARRLAAGTPTSASHERDASAGER